MPDALTLVLLGLSLGVVVMIPFAVIAARRTEQRVRRLEQRARSAERLAELGTMTSGLAHEIKNPLSTIGLNLQMLAEMAEDFELSEEQRIRMNRRIESLSHETVHLRSILEDFLKFAGRVRPDAQPTNVIAVLSELVDFFEPQAEASGVQLRTQFPNAEEPAQLDPMLFKQAVLNLLINATAAMVDVRYSDKPHGGSTDLILRTEALDGEVKVHVIDTGPGIDPQTLDKIFHPYFTSKAEGTGLGLPTARRIIEEHGGTLSVHSEPGRGSDFVITIPRSFRGRSDEIAQDDSSG